MRDGPTSDLPILSNIMRVLATGPISSKSVLSGLGYLQLAAHDGVVQVGDVDGVVRWLEPILSAFIGSLMTPGLLSLSCRSRAW